FFFQAEDGIRDFHVTGVQTCALPIYASQYLLAILLNINPLLFIDIALRSAGRGEETHPFSRGPVQGDPTALATLIYGKNERLFGWGCCGSARHQWHAQVRREP